MDFAKLGQAIVAAMIIALFVDKIIKPITSALSKPKGERLAALAALWPFYVALASGAALGWFTNINLFPVFSASPIVGRVLTALGIGLGPAPLHDLAKAAIEALKAVPQLKRS